jgi:transcription elongation factor GreB
MSDRPPDNDIDDEDDGDDEELPDALNALPPGVKNYITPDGFQRLQDEFHQLRRVERPKVVETVSWAAGNGDRSENGDYIYGKRRLHEIDRRTRFIRKRLEIAEVVDPSRQQNLDRVFFGATVTYAGGDDIERTIRIVGVDEARIERDEVSWISPIARALMKAAEGDIVKLRTPNGIEEIEVVEISFGTPTDPA